jgi:hypothetical protein
MSTRAETAVAIRLGTYPWQKAISDLNIDSESFYDSRGTFWNRFQYLDSIEDL